MLTSDKLILVELHKVGSTRLKKLVGEIVGGESSAKQSAYSDELAATGKPVVGYVCNPLTWYLAHWKLGCEGKGEFHKRLTDETKWDLLRSKRAQLPPKNESAKEAKVLPEGWGAARAKDFWYADANNPEAFREWLQAVAAHRALRRLVDHAYNNSPVAKLGGLMTYQFFIMFVRNAENMEKSVDSMEALQALWEAKSITSRFIRAEAISEDLKKVLEALHVPLNDEQRAAVDGLKERTGADEAAILRFYDAASLRLVAKREAFLNQLFGYGPPSDEARAVARAAKKSPDQQAEGPKLSTAEKEQKRQARAERQAAKEARKAAGGAKKDRATKAADQAPQKKAEKKADKPAGAAKPEKLKRVKNKPLDEDVVDSEE
jgi:hypothetical protein